MLIFYQLLPHCRRWLLVIIFVVGVLLSLLASQLWRLTVKVVVVGFLSLLYFRRCQQRRPFLWMSPLASAPRRRCHRRCWVYYRRQRLFVVVVVGFLSLVLSSLGLLLSAASCCCCWRRRRGVI